MNHACAPTKEMAQLDAAIKRANTGKRYVVRLCVCGNGYVIRRKPKQVRRMAA
jgi:hypothetical protein